ncbi:MAG: ATP-binding protein [Hydrogenovibrio sp.]|uniref:ATP-binding protein n=1 Tax=Hydrogenovibrio sp. TaxID=2065821 RepID=UPI00286FDDFA|nr:ATP-binding protein [Hydrogenovibrio sp.]MDR9498036.1 ATP-binding protein [Hydrogenovibrio sp.]
MTMKADAMIRWVERLSPLIAVFLILGISVVFWLHYVQTEQRSHRIAVEDASNFSHSVAQYRNFYATQIIPALDQYDVPVTHDYAIEDGSIPLPATFAIDFGDKLSEESQYRVRLYSDQPFAWRENGGIRDAFQKDAMDYLRDHPAESYSRYEVIDDQKVLRFAVADVLHSQSCVSCHNSYPGTPRTDWALGDVRGVLEVQRPVSSLQAVTNQSAWVTFGAMLLMALTATLILALVLRRMKQALATSRQQQKALSQARDEAERANQAKSDFLSAMSHELRTPLNSIIGFSQLLELEDLSADQKNQIGIIHGSGKHLLQLIDDVLAFAKLESGQLRIQIEEVNVKSVIQEVLTLTQQEREARRIDLVFEPVRSEEYLNVDRLRLKQVVLNLMSNAIKYNREGGQIRLSCRTLTRGGRPYWAMTIADTGEGIAPEKLNQLFEPFNRLGYENSDIEGTGIGLSITKDLVETMEGSIEVESQVGVGTTFSIAFPLARETARTGSCDASTEASAQESMASCVYAATDPQALQAVSQWAEAAGEPLALRIAPTRNNLLDQLAQRPPDAVMLDVAFVLAQPDAQHFLTQLNERLTTQPVLFLYQTREQADFCQAWLSYQPAWACREFEAEAVSEFWQARLLNDI